jgi:hypothetical protein
MILEAVLYPLSHSLHVPFAGVLDAFRLEDARRYLSRLLPVVSTCRRPHHGNFSLRGAAVSLRQKARQDLAGSQCRCRWLIRYMPPSITRTVAVGMFSG